MFDIFFEKTLFQIDQKHLQDHGIKKKNSPLERFYWKLHAAFINHTLFIQMLIFL